MENVVQKSPMLQLSGGKYSLAPRLSQKIHLQHEELSYNTHVVLTCSQFIVWSMAGVANPSLLSPVQFQWTIWVWKCWQY